MSILLTLQQRFPDLPTRFKNALDRLAENHILDPYNLPFQQDLSQAANKSGITKEFGYSARLDNKHERAP